MSNNTKIAIFTPYFGHINSFFKVWLRSAVFNNSIDFFIPTDCDTEIVDTGFVGKNIHLIPMTLMDFKKRADETIGFDCNVDHVRKVCDYRCALGLMFHKELEGFDFWGYTDNDQVFGNIRKFLTDDILGNFDKIGRWGHFSLYKNIDYMNKLFMYNSGEKDVLYYKDVFSTPYNCFFEESTMVVFCKMNGFNFFDCEDILFDISPYSFKFIDRKWDNKKTPYYVLEDGINLYAVSCSKKNLFKKKEVMYAHFQKRKLDIRIDDISKNQQLIFYPNCIENAAIFDKKRIVKQSTKVKPLYGLKRELLHKLGVRYNNYHKKHSKAFKQKYY